MKHYFTMGVLFALIVCLAYLAADSRPEAPPIRPTIEDFRAQESLQADREALRDTVRDTVWRVIRKAAGVRVDTVLRTETDTFTVVVRLADSALTCYKTRDSLFRVDSIRRAQIESMTCPQTSRWAGAGMFAGGTVLGFLLGSTTTAIIGGN